MSELKEMNLKAFFHDPFHKPLVLAAGKKHKEVAKEIAEIFGIKLTDEDMKFLKGMDILASATERMVLPEGADKEEKYQVMGFQEILFRHPLSGKAYKLNLSYDDYRKAENAIKKVLKEFALKLQGRSEIEKLEYLWQNLLKKLKEKEPDIPWELLPADTRVPDHTIWNHLKLSTVTKAYWHKGNLYATASLFIFTIGPVQSFIKVARKAQDFWAGSFMLSFLTFKAIEEVKKRYASTAIIYPDLQEHPWIHQQNKSEITRPTIPNRFVALLPENDPEKLKEIGKSCEKAVREELVKWANFVLDKLNLNGNHHLKNVIDRHLKNAFVTYWVAIPFPKGKDEKKDYEEAIEILMKFLSAEKIERAKTLVEFTKGSELMYEPNIGALFGYLYSFAEKALAARKTLRGDLFGYPEPSNQRVATKTTRVERCHLCGERNSIVMRKDDKLYYYDENDFQWKTLPGASGLVGYRFLPENEALCTICLIKRFLPEIILKEQKNFPQKFSFPSVSHIAAADFIEEVLEKNVQDYKEFKRAIQIIHKDSDIRPTGKPIPKIQATPKRSIYEEEIIEGEWFYEASLNKSVIKRTLGVEVEEEDLKRAQKALKKIVKNLNRNPCPYYAFIAIDGDHMGKWLAGERGFPFNEDTNIYHPKVWSNLSDSFKEKIRKLFKVTEGNWLHPITPAYHASIAKALQTFALKIVPKIVEEQHLGQLIYAGGDDVLAFVNLRDLWKVLRLLRLGYSGMIKVSEKGLIEEDKTNSSGIVKTVDGYWLTMGPRASLSAGIVIAHYKTPLSVVISEGFKMEKRAKNELQRDAFSITWLKHSGEITISGAKWNIENEPDTIELAEEIFTYFSKPLQGGDRKFWISRSFLKEIRTLYEKIAINKENAQDIKYVLKIFEPLIERALIRHSNFTEKLNSRKKRKILAEPFDRIKSLFERVNSISSTINLIEMGLIHTRFANMEE